MGSRPAKAGADTAEGSGPNGSEGDAQVTTSGRDAAAAQQPDEQRPDPQEVARLQAANERMSSQISALKDELNKEIELNAELQTQASRRQQTAAFAVTAALAAAAMLAAVLYKRRR